VKRALVALAACGGHPAPVPVPPATTVVARVADAAVADAPPAPCAWLDKALADYEAAEKAWADEMNASCAEHPETCQGADYPGPPTCVDTRIDIVDLAPPWRPGEMVCTNPESTYSDPQCSLTFPAGDGVVDVDLGEVERLRVPEVTGARLVDVIAGGAAELLVTLHRDHGSTDSIVVCRADPPECTAPLLIAGLDDNNDPWSVLVRVDGHRLVFEPSTGAPPPGVLGPHTISF
jgi:hypothetical protein